jgi:type VI secretion system protein ImpG
MQVVKPDARTRPAAEYRPYLSRDHFVAPGKVVHFWRVRHDRLALPDGRRVELSLCDTHQRPIADESGTLFAELTCSNGGLPATLPYGRSGGDLSANTIPGEYPIRLLGRPSVPRRFVVDGGNHWRLLCGQSLQVHALSTAGLPAFRAMLAAHALDALGGPWRQIAGIADLCHAIEEARMPAPGGPVLRTGVAVRITLDETAFAGTSLHAFAQVMERLLGLYVHTNSFTRLLLISRQSGAQLLCRAPRQGSLELM